MGSDDSGRNAFYDRARSVDLAPLWRVLNALVAKEPASPAVPALWRYEQVRPFLIEAGALIGTEEAERRVLMLENPGLPAESKVTRSLYAGLQVVMPGEIARAHRHVAAALRLVVEGSGGYTTVDAERTTMSPGDFIVTPSWTWHEHGNDGSGPIIWLDVLDVHVVNLLDCGFRQDHEERPATVARPSGASDAEAALNMLPINYDRTRGTSPIFNYPYARTREALQGIAHFRDPEPAFGFKMRYVNPLNGDWAIPTLATWAQLLPRGFETSPYRSTDGTVFVVIEGSGYSIIGGRRFDWTEHDVFVVPSWCESSHHAAAESVLFGASDRVIQEKLGLWRERLRN